MSADLVYSYTYLFCVIAFAVAIPIYAWMRKNSPDLTWHRQGKVATSEFNRLDVFGVGFLVLIIGILMVLAQLPPELDPDGKPKEIKLTPQIMLAGMISTQVVFLFFVFVLMMFRGTDFVKLLGLRSSKPFRRRRAACWDRLPRRAAT